MLFVLQGGKLVYPSRQNICLSNKSSDSSHAEQVYNGRSAICTESILWKSSMSCKGLWTSRIPDMKCPVTFVKKKKKYIYISRSQYVKGNGDHILGLGQSNFGGHFWRECCFRIVMPDYTLVTPQWTSWNTWNGEILPHTPCSPDLAWSDFQMFPKIMKHLQGLHLHNDKNVKE